MYELDLAQRLTAKSNPLKTRGKRDAANSVRQ
jgi:hypothetical protein